MERGYIIEIDLKSTGITQSLINHLYIAGVFQWIKQWVTKDKFSIVLLLTESISRFPFKIWQNLDKLKNEKYEF